MSQRNQSLHTSRRKGDTVQISGDYQFRAINSNNAVQRFWHESKMTAIDCLCPPLKNSQVLDVGCGSGVISHYLIEKYGADVTALDGNIDAINFGRINYPNVKFLHKLVDDNYHAPEGGFDNIYCLELIEHLNEVQGEELINNFYRLLKPGGKLFLTTPNYRSFWPAIEWLLDLFKITPRLAGDQHVTRYYPNKIISILRRHFIIESACTNCFLAPWLAPISFRFSRYLGIRELRSKFFLGSIIILVVSKKK